MGVAAWLKKQSIFSSIMDTQWWYLSKILLEIARSFFKDTTPYLRLNEKIWGPDDSQSGMRRWTRQLQRNQRVAVLLGRGQSMCVTRYVGFVITAIVESTWWMLMAWCPFSIVPYATVMITGALVACMWCPVWQTDFLSIAHTFSGSYMTRNLFKALYLNVRWSQQFEN